MVPKIENLLTMNTVVVPQRKAAKARKRCRSFFVKVLLNLSINFVHFIDKEASSEEEYVNEDDDDDEAEIESDDEVERPNRRSSAAKRKSIAIQSKDQTERWGNYRNTIDNGPVPRIYLLLNN